MNLNTNHINHQIKQYSPYKELAALSVRPYIPFFSLLNNESLMFPYPEESPGYFAITGNQFAAEIALKFRLHPIFTTIRRAEIALRRNNINLLLPDSLLQDVAPEHAPYLDNVDLLGNSIYECLLSLAVIYRNTKAVELLLNTCDISPNKGMVAALGESNSHMVHLLLSHGANTGTHLHTELLKKSPSEHIVRTLLHHGAKKTVKLGNTGNNALSCALSIKSSIREPFLDLLAKDKVHLTTSEIEHLETEQTPEYHFSLNHVEENGNALMDHIYDKNAQSIAPPIEALIKEMSSNAFSFIVNAYIAAQEGKPKIRRSKGRIFRELQKAIFHPNFQIPEYDHLFIKAYENAHPYDETRLLEVIASLKTPLGRETILRETPEVTTGFYGRMRREEPAFAEPIKIEYPDVFEETNPVELNSEGFLLRLRPCNTISLASDMLDAFCAITDALVRGDASLTDEHKKEFLKSIIEENRTDDLGDIRLEKLWCIYRYAHLQSTEWHEFIHLTSILALVWLIYLHEHKKEWIWGFYPCIPEHQSRREIQRLINNATMKLYRLQLRSNRHGEIFTLYAVELLTAVGIHGYPMPRYHSRFIEFLDSIIEDYRETLEEDKKIVMDSYQRFSPSIAIIGEVDVTERIKKLLDSTL